MYSKRGQAAVAYGRSLRMIKAKDVTVGMLMFEQAGPLGGKTGWFEVTKSELSDSGSYSVDGIEHKYWLLETSQGGLMTQPESEVQAVASRERLQEIKALALAYQATLTKQGKVSKRSAQGVL